MDTTDDRAAEEHTTSGSVELDLRFDERGLIPVVVQEAATRDVLMLAWMDAEAVHRTRASGQATYWSRSRQEYWVKGETSGYRQAVRELRVDCDGDTLLLTVDQTGPACHTGTTTCFDDGLIR
ncbi:MAG: phosphoribosyl-AMP cyclohydrolase [Nocardioidaceae bacterium]